MWVNEHELADGVDNDGNGLIDDIDGWNFVDGNNDTTESRNDPLTTVAGHGTFIAGLVALLAPECRIMPVRTFPVEGVTDAFTVAAAVKYAADHGADVINLSLGSSAPSALLQEALVDARARGIMIVAAVGNDGSETNPQFPSILPEVLAVAAIDVSSHKASFSNFGNHVDVCAPGDRLVSTFPGNREGEYARWSGTSFAAPLAAAEAALVLSADRHQPDVKQVIEDTAVGIDHLNPGLAAKLGKGRIDPLRALQSLNTAASPRPTSDVHSQIELTRAPGDIVAC
jgi:subtilisin family serine protease